MAGREISVHKTLKRYFFSAHTGAINRLRGTSSGDYNRQLGQNYVRYRHLLLHNIYLVHNGVSTLEESLFQFRVGCRSCAVGSCGGKLRTQALGVGPGADRPAIILQSAAAAATRLAKSLSSYLQSQYRLSNSISPNELCRRSR